MITVYVCFESAYLWHHIVGDRLVTDDIDVAVACQIIIVVLKLL